MDEEIKNDPFAQAGSSGQGMNPGMNQSPPQPAIARNNIPWGKINKDKVFMGLAVLAVIITIGLFFNNLYPNKLTSFVELNFKISPEAVAKKSVEHLNKNILQGRTATLVGFAPEGGVIKITLEIDGNKYDSYATRDGKLFFPEALKIGQAPKQAPAQ